MQHEARGTEAGEEHLARGLSQVPGGAHGELLEQAPRGAAHSGEVVDRQGAQEASLVAGQDLGHAAGLGQHAGQARQGAAGADADGERQADLGADLGPQALGGREGRAAQARAAGEVDEEVVDRGLLDQGRSAQCDPRHRAPQAVGGLGVPAPEEGLGAAARGLGQEHPRPHATGAHVVGARHDQVALVGQPSDHQRPAAQLWVHHLLDRGQEGVDVQVQDAPGGGSPGEDAGSGVGVAGRRAGGHGRPPPGTLTEP